MASIILPPDIIREIFSYFSSTLGTQYARNFPWFLGHICSEWRAIFLTMRPEFWSTIDILLLEDVREKAPHILEMTKSFVKRNPEDPLSFRFMHSRYESAESLGVFDQINAIFGILAKEAERWVDVEIHLHRLDFAILRRVKHRVPLLRKFFITTAYTHDLPHLMNCLQDAPSLRELIIHDGRAVKRAEEEAIVSNIISVWKLDWSALTTLDISIAFFSQDVLAILSQTCNLESLSIVQGYPLVGTIERPIRFPCLKKLSIEAIPRTVGLPLLEVAEAPALQDLTLSIGEQSDAVVSFLSRSSCTILRLTVTEMASEPFSHILQHTPHIVHLAVSKNASRRPNHSPDIEYLNACNYPFARHLQSLSINHLAHSRHLDLPQIAQQLIDVVKSRTRVGNITTERLRSLVIKHKAYSTSLRHELDGLKSLCDDVGVDFQY